MPGKRIPNLIRCFNTPRLFYISGELLLRSFCQPQADLRLDQKGPKNQGPTDYPPEAYFLKDQKVGKKSWRTETRGRFITPRYLIAQTSSSPIICDPSYVGILDLRINYFVAASCRCEQ